MVKLTNKDIDFLHNVNDLKWYSAEDWINIILVYFGVRPAFWLDHEADMSRCQIITEYFGNKLSIKATVYKHGNVEYPSIFIYNNKLVKGIDKIPSSYKEVKKSLDKKIGTVLGFVCPGDLKYHKKERVAYNIDYGRLQVFAEVCLKKHYEKAEAHYKVIEYKCNELFKIISKYLPKLINKKPKLFKLTYTKMPIM